ncbi:unnamed protein product, partial [Brassica rapa]
LCVLNRQTQTVHGKGQRAESKDQRADMCTDGQPRTSSTDVLCVLTNTHGRLVCADRHPQTSCPTWAKITQTVHGKGQRADMCTDGQPRTFSTDILCVLTDTHGRPVCADEHTRTACTMWAKITQTVHGKGQRAQSKDQRADMCTDGQPRTSSTDVLCVLTDSHRRLVYILCVLADTHGLHGKGQRAESKDQLHGKGQRAESKDQSSDMCTDGQPRTFCVC